MKIFLFCYLRAHLAPLNHAESHIYYLSFKLPLLASELCHSLSDELASGSENFGGGRFGSASGSLFPHGGPGIC